MFLSGFKLYNLYRLGLAGAFLTAGGLISLCRQTYAGGPLHLIKALLLIETILAGVVCQLVSLSGLYATDVAALSGLALVMLALAGAESAVALAIIVAVRQRYGASTVASLSLLKA